MSNQESNSKRIAKNTLLLYFRMILIMVVSGQRKNLRDS